MQQVSLTRSWATNKPLNEVPQIKCPDDADECTFKNIVIEQILNMLPPIPSISQDGHLSIQCGRWDDPTSQLLSWNRASLPFRSSNDTSVPTLYLNKYRPTQSNTNQAKSGNSIHPTIYCKGIQPIPPTQSVINSAGHGVKHVVNMVVDMLCNMTPTHHPQLSAYTSGRPSIQNKQTTAGTNSPS